MADRPRIAIDGFGRIGRLAARALLERQELGQLVAVNDIADPQVLAHLFKHDTVHGAWPGPVSGTDGWLHIDDQRIRLSRESDPGDCAWEDLDIDYVLECTGHWRRRADLMRILDTGARRVIVSAPAAEADTTIVLGVNDHDYDPSSHVIISNASCTTNCLAPILKVLHDAIGIQHASMTTVHAYTNDQRLLDAPHTDLRRARAAGTSMIPATTGAAQAIGRVLPGLDGRVDGHAIRVPVADVSLIDLTIHFARPAKAGEAESALMRASEGPMRGLLRCEDEPLVSADFIHDAHSAIFDLSSCAQHAEGRVLRCIAWYDNEWAYANRLIELAALIWQAEPDSGIQEKSPEPKQASVN